MCKYSKFSYLYALICCNDTIGCVRCRALHRFDKIDSAIYVILKHTFLYVRNFAFYSNKSVILKELKIY